MDRQTRREAVRKAYEREGLRDSESSDEVKTCEFCDKPLEYHETEFRGRVFRFRPKPCTCDQAQAIHAEKEREIEEERRKHEVIIHRMRVDEARRNSLIPERWGTRTFEHFKVTQQNRAAYEAALEYANTFGQVKGNGLIFTGSVGSGKTHLSAAIALRLLENEKTVIYGTVSTLLAQIRSTYSDDKQDERKVFERMVGCDLLIIDDLGKEKVTEWVDQIIFEIINTRYERNKSLVITTNLSLSEIKVKYENTGEAVVSRILEMCQGVKMNGPDWRKQAVRG